MPACCPPRQPRPTLDSRSVPLLGEPKATNHPDALAEPIEEVRTVLEGWRLGQVDVSVRRSEVMMPECLEGGALG